MKRFLVLTVSLLFLFSLAGESLAQNKVVKIPTCWMESSEAFEIWYAKKKGWDKEEGLDIEMLDFNSGPAQIEALPAHQWVMGGTGAGGELIGGMRHNIYILAPVITEDEVERFYVRKDSPILKTKGYNPQYPNLYGTPETVKGATILLTTQTTVHYMIGAWLKALGLKESDVKMTNMDMPSIVPAFEKGIGDVCGVWAPVTFNCESRGWVAAGSTGSAKATTATCLIGDKEWCDKNPELTAKFIRVYFRVSELIRKEGESPEMIKAYQEFMNDFCGLKMDAAEVKKELDVHPRWTLKEAIALSDSSKGDSQVTKWINDAAEFFTQLGKFNQDELAKFKSNDIVTDKFMKVAAEKPLP